MRSSKPLNNSGEVIKKLVQKLSDRGGRVFRSSFYSGISVANFIDKLETNEEDIIIIKVNKGAYEPILHDMKLIKSYRIRQEMVRKEFKEKIVLQLRSADDLLRISSDTKEFKSTYGYVVKIIIHITTE